MGTVEVCCFGKDDSRVGLPETTLREVPEMDSQHHSMINNGRIEFKLLLVVTAVVVRSLPDHRQPGKGRKASK